MKIAIDDDVKAVTASAVLPNGKTHSFELRGGRPPVGGETIKVRQSDTDTTGKFLVLAAAHL